MEQKVESLFLYSLAEGDQEAEDLTLSFLSEIRGDSSNPEYFWNQSMWSSFSHLPHDIASKWLVPIICGYVGSKRVYAGSRQASG